MVENEKWTMTDIPNVAVTKLVAVEVYGYTLVLRSNQLKTIMVSKQQDSEPFPFSVKLRTDK